MEFTGAAGRFVFGRPSPPTEGLLGWAIHTGPDSRMVVIGFDPIFSTHNLLDRLEVYVAATGLQVSHGAATPDRNLKIAWANDPQPFLVRTPHVVGDHHDGAWAGGGPRFGRGNVRPWTGRVPPPLGLHRHGPSWRLADSLSKNPDSLWRVLQGRQLGALPGHRCRRTILLDRLPKRAGNQPAGGAGDLYP